MLSAATLERVSVAYRRGYYDGHDGKPRLCEVKPGYIKPFAQHDYENGYLAGQNDAKWERHHSARTRRSSIQTADIPAAIAEVMVERHAASGACTESDLIAAGFTLDEIACHADAARTLAATQTGEQP